MDRAKINELKRRAMEIRIAGLEMVQAAHSGHIGGSFSLAEIVSVLYFDKMQVRPDEPEWAGRDRLVLSKGHCTVALYPALAMRGFFPMEKLRTFRKIDSKLSGHAERHVPGVDMSTGSLGQGFSTAVGMALAAKQGKEDYTTYAILGDGECQEGQIWEACMFASHYKLDNLIAILDNNRVQLDGHTCFVMDLLDPGAKFESFGFNVIEIDGHDVQQIAETIERAKACKGKPSVIIANTVKGKGVPLFEDNNVWHGKVPNDQEFAEAFSALRETLNEMEG